MSLTDIAIRNARPADKLQRLFDGNGLYLEVSPSGGKWWRLKYRIDGKEKRLSIGVYPDVGLRDAREKSWTLRKQISAGIDPALTRKTIKIMARSAAQNTFEAVAREWHLKFLPTWNAKHAENILSRLERFVFPIIGKRPIAQIEPPEILHVLQRIEARGTVETAHRVKGAVGQVMRYAVLTARAKRDPTADLRGALAPAPISHFATVTNKDEIGQLLRAIRGYTGSFSVLCALRFSPLVFQRPGEVREAEWEEFDLDGATWEIPAERMKGRKAQKAARADHIVPLSRQAVELLEELHRLTGHGRYLFPSIRTSTRPMSINSLTGALRRLGYDGQTMTVHGFRAMARTLLDEELGIPVPVIEAQLAHKVRDPLGRAYNRTTFLPQRREMMQRWADYLDELEATRPAAR